jgi:hypothetical protein
MLGLLGLVRFPYQHLFILLIKGVNVLVLAPICASDCRFVSARPDGFSSIKGNPAHAVHPSFHVGPRQIHTSVFSRFFYFGAIFGKLMNDSRAAEVIGMGISKKLGSHHAILATVSGLRNTDLWWCFIIRGRFLRSYQLPLHSFRKQEFIAVIFPAQLPWAHSPSP